MKSFFSGNSSSNGGGAAPALPSPGGGGWSSLSGAAKLAIAAGVATAVIVAVMWPNLTSQPKQTQQTAQDHPAATISDYQAPPPVTATADADNRPPQAVYRRPVPTEMALYSAPPQVLGTSAPAPLAIPAAASQSGDGLPPTNHGRIIHNPDFLIRAGDAIPCLPVEANRSDKASSLTCDVPGWFRSSNQKRGLLSPHTRLFGQIRDGLQAGEERLGVTFSVIETKWFDMPIDSPGNDVMGRGGLDADIKTFFWDRAGAVALYALLDASVGIGQSLATNSFSNSRFGGTNFNFTGPGEQLAGREFDHRINRPPLATRDQAQPITVIVGQTLDFYDLCQAAMKVDPMACPVMAR